MNLVYRRFWPWNSCFCVTSSLQFCTIVPYLQSETESPFEFAPAGLHPRVGHTPAGQLWWWWRWWFGLEFGESLRVAMFWKLVLQMVICTCQSLSLSSCHIRGQVWCQGQFCVWCSERDSEFICVGPGSIQSHTIMISHCSLEASSRGNGTKVKHANWIAAPLTSENEFIHERSQKNDGSSSLGGTSRSGNIAVGLKAPWHFISFMAKSPGDFGLEMFEHRANIYAGTVWWLFIQLISEHP